MPYFALRASKGSQLASPVVRMNRTVLVEGLADLLDIEADQVADLYVGDLALGLHLADPTKRWPGGFVEEGFEEAVGVYKLRLLV